jgi:hypothetical protein
MAELNAVGDVVLTDPKAMRALASAERLALHDALRRRGAMAADDMAALLGLATGDVLDHVAALEEVGLVERSEARSDGTDTWVAIGKGVYFEIPDDPEGQEAARSLSSVMLLQYAELPRRWVAEDEPRLPIAWARAAGMLHARVVVTPAELEDIQAALEGVLEPYLRRQPGNEPGEARQARILSYFMPESGDETAGR